MDVAVRLPAINQDSAVIGQRTDRMIDQKLCIGALNLDDNVDGRDALANSPCREARPAQTLHARCVMPSTYAPPSGTWRLAAGRPEETIVLPRPRLFPSQSAGFVADLFQSATIARERRLRIRLLGGREIDRLDPLHIRRLNSSGPVTTGFVASSSMLTLIPLPGDGRIRRRSWLRPG